VWRRLWALIQKEFIQLTRDRRTLIALMVAPSLELILFGAAIHTDVKHIPMVVADQSMSPASRAYLNAFVDSESFDIVSAVSGPAEVVRAIDGGQANIGMVIPPDFADQAGRREARVLMLVDGSTSFTAQSAYNTANATSQLYAVSLTGQRSSPLTAHIQILYNPDLKDLWFITPAFIAFLLQSLTMNLTSLAIAREREAGTIEAILVTPIRPIELMLAKTIPSLLVTFGSGFILFVVSILVLGVPFRGNLLLFLGLSLIAVGCGLGLGLAVSTAVQTQNQSVQLGSMLNLTGMFLAGVLFPTYTLPLVLRVLSYVFPATYFIPVLLGLCLLTLGIVVGIGVLWFGVPFEGSPFLYCWLALLFIASCLGLGLLLSTRATTQMEATQYGLMFMLVGILMSGFMYAQSAMPLALQVIGGLFPVTYFIRISRGIFLKGVGLNFVWSDALILVGYSVAVVVVAAKSFRRRLD